MLGGESTSCSITCVFFRLMVSPKSWQTSLKWFMSCWRPPAEWAVTAASSAKRKSRRHFNSTLNFALKEHPVRPGSDSRCLPLQIRRHASGERQRRSQTESVPGRSPILRHCRCQKGQMSSRQRPQCPLPHIYVKTIKFYLPEYLSAMSS